MKKYNINRLDVVNYISHGVIKPDSGTFESNNASINDSVETQDEKLENFATNLNIQASKGQIDPLIGGK